MVISAGTSDVAQPSSKIMRNFRKGRASFGRRLWRLRMDRRTGQQQEPQSELGDPYRSDPHDYPRPATRTSVWRIR